MTASQTAMTTDAQRRVAVARAICKSRTCEGVSCCQWPANGGRTNCPVKNGGYDDAADAAIAALAPAPGDAREVDIAVRLAAKIRAWDDKAEFLSRDGCQSLAEYLAVLFDAHSQAAVARERAECAKVLNDYASSLSDYVTLAAIRKCVAAIESRA